MTRARRPGAVAGRGGIEHDPCPASKPSCLAKIRAPGTIWQRLLTRAALFRMLALWHFGTWHLTRCPRVAPSAFRVALPLAPRDPPAKLGPVHPQRPRRPRHVPSLADQRLLNDLIGGQRQHALRGD